MKRVTDLEKFALEEVWRPYQNMMGYEKRLERLPVGLEETARLLRADTTGWSKRVIDRIKNIGVTFPDYIQHPLVDVFGGGTKSDGGVEGHAQATPDYNGVKSPALIIASEPSESLCSAAGIKPGPSDPAQEPQAVALKPCPFCGEAEIRYERTITDGTVWCSHCGVKSTQLSYNNSDGLTAAATIWNTRPVSLDRLTESNISDEICHVFGCRSTCVSECNSEINKDKCGEAARRVLALIEGRM